jgi:hypothetical protein
MASILQEAPESSLSALLASGLIREGTKIVPIEDLESLLENPCDWRNPEKEGKYLSYDPKGPGRWITIDNSSGDCWTEEWAHWESALEYLADDAIDVEGLLTKDRGMK